MTLFLKKCQQLVKLLSLKFSKDVNKFPNETFKSDGRVLRCEN